MRLSQLQECTQDVVGIDPQSKKGTAESGDTPGLSAPRRSRRRRVSRDRGSWSLCRHGCPRNEGETSDGAADPTWVYKNISGNGSGFLFLEDEDCREVGGECCVRSSSARPWVIQLEVNDCHTSNLVRHTLGRFDAGDEHHIDTDDEILCSWSEEMVVVTTMTWLQPLLACSRLWRLQFSWSLPSRLPYN